MKIAVVGDVSGGPGCASSKAEHYDLVKLSRALTDRGHSVRVFTASLGDEAPRAVPFISRMPVGVIDASNPEGLMPFIGEMGRHLVETWERDTPEVVHCHGPSYGMAAQLAAKRFPVPTVQSFHGLGATARRHHFERRPTDAALKVENLLARNASALTADCTDDVQELMRMGCVRAKVSVLPTGVDVDELSAADSVGTRGNPRGLRIVAAARNFSPSHGLTDILRLLPSLPAAELILVATDDADAGVIAALASDLNVADRVRTRSGVAEAALGSHFRTADVAVCPSGYESSCGIVLQAMAAGVPVVACASGGAADAVVADVTGILVPPNSREALSRALRSVINQTVLRQGMGLAGRSRARSRYSWDRIATEAELIYAAALSRHRMRPPLPPAGVA